MVSEDFRSVNADKFLLWFIAVNQQVSLALLQLLEIVLLNLKADL